MLYRSQATQQFVFTYIVIIPTDMSQALVVFTAEYSRDSMPVSIMNLPVLILKYNWGDLSDIALLSSNYLRVRTEFPCY